MTSSLATFIQDFLVQNAKLDPAVFDKADLRIEELGLDSLGLVEMLFEIEDRFGFQIQEPMRFQTMRFSEMVAAIEADVRAHHGGELPDLLAVETADQ